METRRWTNPSQPQTLYLAVILLYVNAAIGVIFGLMFAAFGVIDFVVVAGEVASGLGIANERKWGYVLGVIMAALSVGLRVLWPLVIKGPAEILDPSFLIGAIFPVVLFALLVHPMSREYQRIWFK